jgi:hypothetical protein
MDNQKQSKRIKTLSFNLLLSTPRFERVSRSGGQKVPQRGFEAILGGLPQKGVSEKTLSCLHFVNMILELKKGLGKNKMPL